MKLRYFVPLLFSALTLASCNLFPHHEQAPATTITLNAESLELDAGATFTLVATVNTTNASLNKTVNFQSKNSNVATVGGTSGKITVKSTAAGGQTAKIVAYLKADTTIQAICNVTVNTINPTSISLSYSSLELGPGKTRQLSVTYTPSNVNANKDITWTSSNNNIATVDNGKVVINSNAHPGDTARITAKLTNIPSITASCNITVNNQTADFYTILIYMCGADLESDYANQTTVDGYQWYGWGLATMDIREILSVENKPDDVNIVIETGGATEWTTNYYGQYSDNYDIDPSQIQRHHVENGKIKLDSSLSYTSMGQASTLKSFIEYGLDNYPAQNTGLILWNHGGGLSGVCSDERTHDSLLASEVKTAVSGALSSRGMSGQKLEWIGYDACLMGVQDIAELNSNYFKYMVASQETEVGYGWAYEGWLDDLYAYKSTPQILTAICDSFIKSNDRYDNDPSNNQTLAYYDLSKMAAYKTAWETMASEISLNSSTKYTFKQIIQSCKTFGGNQSTSYGLFDVVDFINKLVASPNLPNSAKPSSSATSAVLTAFADLVPHSAKGAGAGNANGLCFFWRISYSTMSYSSSETTFTTWRALCNSYGG